MREVLLAINGETPTRAAFQYATDLCQQVRAELRILQFTKDSHGSRNVPSPLKKLLADQSGNIPFKLAMSADSPENALSAYVDTHHDIILTVFDSARDNCTSPPPKPIRMERLKKSLGVPLVVVKQ